MDRNHLYTSSGVDFAEVALRKESVDRNIASRQLPATEPPVALRKESVDRNGISHSAVIRRAVVALRKESVDRNYYANRDCDWVRVSLSARRAWIEISRA